MSDARGRGRMAGVPGGGLTVGGGTIGLILTVLAVLFGGNLTGGGGTIDTGESSPYGGLANQATDGAGGGTAAIETCRTGADANARDDCRVVGYVNSIQAFWQNEYARRGSRYQPARTTFFSGSINTGCGGATSRVGPFYCPNDQNVYLDLGFFNELRTKFGASAGPLAQAYVIAHEYGHHIQNLTGVLEQRKDQQTGPQSNAVRIELQADCLAGVWTSNAVSTGYLQPITEVQIRDALNAAASVGDDRIQERVQGQVRPHAWTHGSADQRQTWFVRGLQSGDLATCDTFRGTV